VRRVLQNGCQVAALCSFQLISTSYWSSAIGISEKHCPSSFHVPSPTPPPALAALPPRPHLPLITVAAVRIAATESADSAFTRPPPRGAEGWGLAVEGVLIAGAAASVASASTRNARAAGGNAAEELLLIFLVVLVRARGGVNRA